MDLRSPFVIGLASLPRQEGASIEWEREVEAPPNLGTEMIGVPEASLLDVKLTLQSVSEGVYIGGSVGAHVAGECSRCLRAFEYDVEELVAELAFYPERRLALIEEGDEEAEELPVIEGDHVDVEPIVRDAIVLSFPFTPLCEPDCQGLCSGCGKRWDELPDDHFHAQPVSEDDPLAALEAQLRGNESGEVAQ